MTVYAWLATLLLALVAGFAAGNDYGHGRGQDAVAAAQAGAAVCRSTLEGNTAALSDIKTQLADLRARHAAALEAADAALDARDAQIATLAAAAATRNKTIKESTRADADCAALARMPVCPAVAGQLWPVPAAAAGADRHAR